MKKIVFKIIVKIEPNSKMPRIGISSIILFLLLLSIGVEAASISDSLESKFTADIGVSGEYNDNVYLKNSDSLGYKSDYVFGFSPKLGYNQSYKRQKLSLSVDGDLRKGLTEVPLEANVITSGLLDMSFGDFGAKVQDVYQQSDFDLGLYDYPLIDTRKMNNFGSNIYYNLGNNLTLRGGYANRWFTYTSPVGNFTRRSSEYGGGLSYQYSNRIKLVADYTLFDEEYQLSKSGTYNRNANVLKSKLSFPVSAAVSSYLSYQYEDQISPEQGSKDFTNHQSLVGVKWDQEHKAVLWMEAGYGYLQYADSSSHNYTGLIGNLGFDYNITNNLISHGLIGIDVYKKLVADFELRYKQAEKVQISVFAKRLTKKHFFTSNFGDTYIANNFGGNITAYFSQLLKIKTEVRYYTRDEFSNEFNFLTDRTIYNVLDINLTTTMKFERGSINFKGGFLQYNSLYSQELKNSNRLIYTKMWGDYIIADHYKPGVYLLYARRYSFDDTNAFENLRVGISFSYLF